MRFFQRALLGFKNLWIHFIFSEFNCVSVMAKISSPLFKMEKSWTTCQGGCIFFPVPEEIIYSFLVYFGILQIWPMYHSLDKRVWLTITPFKESHSDPDMDFFAMSSFILLHLELSRVTKVNSMYFNGHFRHFICPGWSILLYMHQSIKGRFFEKLNLWAECIIIVLTSLVTF